MHWQRNVQAQKTGVEAVEFCSLLFSLKQKKAKDVWDVGGGDGSGIGGGDGAGIGGGDGGAPVVGEEIQTVEITFIPGADTAKSFSDSRLEQWRKWLLSGRKVESVFLKNPEAKRLMKIGSLAQFFTFWLRDKYLPVAIRSKAGDLHSDGEQLIRIASVAAGLSQSARDKAMNVDEKAWLSLLRDTAILAQNGLASSTEVLALLNGANDSFWREYYDHDFDSAVALEASIQNLAQQLKKMGL
jgi:hypothetical protein